MRCQLLIALFFICVSAIGCATTPQLKSLLEDSKNLPVKSEITDVPFIEQEKNYCGPASLAMVANWSGKNTTPEALVEMMYTPAKNGTLTSDVLGAARRSGLLAVQINNLQNLLAEISVGHPVMVLQNFGSSKNPVWHYSVVKGYDIPRREVTLYFGNTKNFKMDMEQFERAWMRADYWSVLVLAPNVLPETSSVDQDLNAAIALERVGKIKEANMVYSSISKKWNQSIGAFFGLGNTFAALGEYLSSARAFEAAKKLEPASSAVKNNLSEVYAKLYVSNTNKSRRISHAQ